MEIADIAVGEKIYKFLSKRYAVSFGNLQKFFREKSIRANGIRINENYVLQRGDVININNFASKILLSSQEETRKSNSIRPSTGIINKIKKSIIFEDEKILVINKPYGLSTQGGSGIKISLDDVLPYLSDNTTNLKLVHRLDKDTTGVLIIAKSSKIAKILTEKFKDRDGIKKTYLTVVDGKMKNHDGVINLPLIKKYENSVEKVYVDSIAGKEAITEYRVVAYNKNLNISLVEVNILTGRTHQIRVHMKEIGNPVVGDFKYGKVNDKRICNRMLLHSHRCEVEFDGKVYDFVAPAPDEFGKLFKRIYSTLKFYCNNKNNLHKNILGV
jgi:23S rRNA pseudouridine955/2504/2580 synthase